MPANDLGTIQNEIRFYDVLLLWYSEVSQQATALAFSTCTYLKLRSAAALLNSTCNSCAK